MMFVERAVIVSLCIVSAFFSTVCTAYSPEDFPNYFQEMVRETDTSLAENKIEAALSSILGRLQVAHGYKDTIQTDHFFAKLDRLVKETDPHAQVLVTGGVVQSLLSFLYQEVYSARQRDPRLSTTDILE